MRCRRTFVARGLAAAAFALVVPVLLADESRADEPRAADLFVVGLPKPKSAPVGEVILYYVTATNQGTAAAENVVLRARLTGAGTIVGAHARPPFGPIVVNENAVSTRAASVSGSATIELRVVGAMAGTLRLTAVVTSSTPDINPANNERSVTATVTPPDEPCDPCPRP